MLTALLLSPAALAQYPGYGRPRPWIYGPNPGVNGEPAVTFQGNLKVLGKKELTIDVATEQQSLTFRITRKTHFFKDGKEIKPAAVSVGTVVAVDAVRDPDQKFSALNVIVNPPKPKSDGQGPPPSN